MSKHEEINFVISSTSGVDKDGVPYYKQTYFTQAQITNKLKGCHFSMPLKSHRRGFASQEELVLKLLIDLEKIGGIEEVVLMRQSIILEVSPAYKDIFSKVIQVLTNLYFQGNKNIKVEHVAQDANIHKDKETSGKKESGFTKPELDPTETDIYKALTRKVR